MSLTLAAAGCGGAANGSSAMDTGEPAFDAGDAFGNAAGGAAPREPSLTLINDGGAGLLPDGAIVYLALWARPCPMDSTLSYESFGRNFFDLYCLRCHSAAREGIERGGAPPSANFDALDAISARKDAIWSMAADDNALMPAAGTAPSPAERRLLGDWLACGAR